MKALTWHGIKDVRVENKPEPKVLDDRDAIIEVTSTAICGSDLHMYHGFIVGMKKGDILGHEFAGRVVETGSQVSRLKIGDRVVIPFPIACGSCAQCAKQYYSLCEISNPNKELEKLLGYPTAGIYGYSHMYGGFAGGQSQYVRVPYADTNALILPEGISEEQALFLSDIFPTGYMAAENCDIKPGDIVAVWGCGPVGQFAIKSAFLLGADRVIAIDRFNERLSMARNSGAEIINYEEVSDDHVIDQIKILTHGKGPDACIDAVGMEAHGHSFDALYDEVLQAVRLETDRSHALRQAIQVCRPGGIVSIPGVYIGFLDKFPLGVAFAKGLSFKMGQTHVQKYMPRLLQLIEQNKIDPRFVITHKFKLDEADDAYKLFALKNDNCIKVVLSPN
jgi:threonine dehydrogenase-like Zn-dependent dehydrogenase